jgi:hypothetical protein
MKVLVCGGRKFGKLDQFGPDGSPPLPEVVAKAKAQRQFVNDKLTEISNTRGPITEVVEGGADGADTCAFWWCLMHKIKCTTVRADWDTHGKKAGPIRNSAMLLHEPVLVIAFPGEVGTADMVAKAKKAGIEVIELEFNYEA